jgi:hypothetical protein
MIHATAGRPQPDRNLLECFGLLSLPTVGPKKQPQPTAHGAASIKGQGSREPQTKARPR